MLRPNRKVEFAGLLVTILVLMAGCSNQTPTQGTQNKDEKTSPTTAGKEIVRIPITVALQGTPSSSINEELFVGFAAAKVRHADVVQ